MKAICVFVAAGVVALAQEPRHTIMFQSAPGNRGDVLFNKDVIVAGDHATMAYVSADISGGGKPIKGAPYSAETVNENIQVLPDGNRIVHKNTGVIYRDSEGRMRREQSLEAIGPWSTSGEVTKTIVINDTVAGATYFLDTKNKEAHKLPVILPPPEMGASVGGGPIGLSMGPADVTQLRGIMAKNESGDVKSESLGKQTIEGLVCEGTRVTTTIPQGAIGNERPIEMVTERWFSPELQVVVLSKHSDPRMGESTYKLQGVTRSEPARSLFEVPSDYTLSTENSKMRTMKLDRKPNQ